MSKRAVPVENPVVDDSPPAGKSETLPDEEPYDELAEEVTTPGPSTEYAPPAAPIEENGRIVTPTFKVLTKEVTLAENARDKARANLHAAEGRLRKALAAMNSYTAPF